MTPEQIRLLVEAALREALPAAIRDALLSWYVVGVAALIAGLAAYLGSYLQTRGQRRAIAESLGSIERKTEEIKAEVSGGLWLKQRRWDLRRDVYSQLLEGLQGVYDALDLMMWAQRQIGPTPAGPAQDVHRATFRKGHDQMVQASRAVAKARALGNMLLTQDAVSALDRLEIQWNPVARGKDDLETYETLSAVAGNTIDDLTEIARRDLFGEIPPAAVPPAAPE
jgi:hypothetical protein